MSGSESPRILGSGRARATLKAQVRDFTGFMLTYPRTWRCALVNRDKTRKYEKRVGAGYLLGATARAALIAVRNVSAV
jgi:hypothetical protein